MSEEDKSTAIELYKSGLGTYKIGKILGFGDLAIARFLKKSGISLRNKVPRKFIFRDQNFFDEINSEEKAYYLGLLWADGWNYRTSKKKLVGITLQEDDKHILEKFSNLIFVNPELKEVKTKGNRKRHYTFYIIDSHVSDTLLELGMTSRKSFTLKLPNIELSEDLWRAFFRGYIDGDGWIIHTKKTIGVGFVSSPEFIDQSITLLSKFTGEKFYSYKHPASRPMACMKISGRLKIIKFLNWIYKDSTISLNRKREKYESLFLPLIDVVNQEK